MIDILWDPVESGVSPRRLGSGFDWWDPGWTALDAGWIGTAIVLSGGTLDNTTGGPYAVNGTLQSVTYQIGFLGLNGAVVNAISNATDPSDGLWGPPTAQAPHLQPSGFLGEFWNAVTSFVTNPLGTVLSAIYIVWNAATAAFTYLDHLTHEAIEAGGQVLSRAAATLVSIGKAILSALEKLLSWLVTELTALLNWGLGPFYSIEVSTAESLWSLVDPHPSSVVIGGLTCPLFELGQAVAMAAEIGLGILTALSIGGSFLVQLLVGMVLALGIQALASSIPQVGNPTGALIYTWMNWTGLFTSQQSQAGNWTSWANAWAYWETGVSNTYAAQQLTRDYSNYGKLISGEFSSEVVAFGLSLLAFGCAVAVTHFKNDPNAQIGAITAIILAGVSLGLAVRYLKWPTNSLDDQNILAVVIAVMDGTAIGIALSEDIEWG